MDQQIFDTLDRAKILTEELRVLVARINLLMKEASDIGIYINLNKEQTRSNNGLQTKLELKNATVNLEFSQPQVKIS